MLINPVIADIAKKHGKTPAQIVLRWNLQRSVIVIPKSVLRERQLENPNITNFELSEGDIMQINAFNSDIRLDSDPDNFNF